MNRLLRNRLLWGIAFLVLVAAGGWAQSTWRGQAEVWPTASAPVDGYVAASNEFPRNSLLTVENYRAKKTIQVRIVAALPAGSSALVLLNPKAAQALDIKAGDSPLVGVRLDPTGTDLAENPDPDVNPLAAKPAAAVAVVPAPAPTPVPAPVAEAAVRTPPVTPAAPVAVAASDAVVPLPALANPEPVAEPAPAPLAVADETEAPAPVTPGKKVFLTTRDPEPVATETVPEPSPVHQPEPAPVAETPVVEAPVAQAPVAEPEPEPEPVPVSPVSPGAPLAEAPVAEPTPATSPAPTPVPAAPVPVAPVPVAPPAPVAVAPASPLAVKPAPANAWVSVPGKLEGPVLGQVAVLPALDKGKAYVQVGAFATEADVLASLGQVRSYVPVALYKAAGEKNPWRVVVAAPKAQLGVLLMSFRSQGFRTAAVVKG